VRVRERGARVLRFDHLGNFLGTGSAEGVTFQTRLDVAPPPDGERGWTLPGSGDWDHLHNWFYWNRPDTVREVANLGSVIPAAASVTLDRALHVRGLRFRSPHSYTIEGQGSLRLRRGDHRRHGRRTAVLRRTRFEQPHRVDPRHRPR
jgi:hypothetical protein